MKNVCNWFSKVPRTQLRAGCFLLALLIAQITSAHVALQASALAKISPEGQIKIALTFDTLAYVLNDTTQRIDDLTMNEFLDASPDEQREQIELAEQRFEKSLVVSTDTGQVQLKNLIFPQVKDLDEWKKKNIEPRLPVMLEVTAEGQLPPGSHQVSFRFPEILGTMALTVDMPDLEPQMLGVEPGTQGKIQLPKIVQHNLQPKPAARNMSGWIILAIALIILLVFIRARARGALGPRNATR